MQVHADVSSLFIQILCKSVDLGTVAEEERMLGNFPIRNRITDCVEDEMMAQLAGIV
jgi:hypothetical protein